MIKVSMLEPDLKIHTKYLVPQSIKLIDILQMVGHRTIIKGYGELRRDVEENGFKNPYNEIFPLVGIKKKHGI